MNQKRANKNCKDSPLQVPYSFTIQHFQECDRAARVIQDLFKNDTNRDIETGCHELLVNAIEHGNLEITLDQKLSLIQSGSLLTFLEARLTEQPYKDRKVSINCEKGYYKNKAALMVTITDEGEGFDWAHQIEISQKACPVSQIHGRGILIAKEFAFDDLKYNPCGNQVMGIVYI